MHIDPVRIVSKPVGPQPGNVIELAVGETTPAGGLELARVTVRPEESRDWVVTLSQPNRVINTASPAGAVPFSSDIGFAFARIGWGSGGGRSEVEIDWRQGGQYSFYGSEVIVTFVKEVAVGAGAGPVRLGAHIAPGRISGSYATRTVVYSDIASLADETLPIPPFARELRLERDPVAVGDAFTLEFTRNAGATFLQRMIFQVSASRITGDITQWLQIPTQATFVRIINDAAVNAMGQPQLVYRLAI